MTTNPTPVSKRADEVAQRLEAGETIEAIAFHLTTEGVPLDEATAFVRQTRRRLRKAIVESMIVALENGNDESEIFDQFRDCGESEAWVRKAIAKADAQTEEVLESDPTAFQRANLIALGIFGIAGGLLATVLSSLLEGGNVTMVFWGAILCGFLSLGAGLSLPRREE